MAAVCSVEVCLEPARGRGLCKGHHQRLLAKGAPGTTPIRKKRPGAACSAPSCDRPHYARDLCKPHYWRHLFGQSLHTPIGNHVAPDELVTYHAVHKRLAVVRGPASAQICSRCAGPADQWAYQHNDPDERVDSTGLPYSLDLLDSYAPMCCSCHIRFDQGQRAAQVATA